MMRLVLVLIFLVFAVGIAAQVNIVSITSATGTGKTTGHIATLQVENSTDQPVTISSSTYYIPSRRRFQDYVGRIQEPLLVGPNATALVPIFGYCIDVHLPPVPDGTRIVDFDDWVVVGQPIGTGANNSNSNGSNVVSLTPNNSALPFTTASIPVIESARGFTPAKTDTSNFVVTYPGTDTPIDGTIEPSKSPVAFAPLFVKIVQEVEAATGIIIGNSLSPTPFSKSPDKERETVIQHTIWIVMGVLKDREYEEKDFEANIYKQFEESTGQTIDSIEEADKDKLDEGVTAFWSTFTATGVQAKVLREKT